MVGIGAVQGVSMTGGVLAGFGLIWPIAAVPVLLSVALTLVALFVLFHPRFRRPVEAPW